MENTTEDKELEPHRYLSAPWRMRYLSEGSGTSGCIFCEKLAAHDDIDNLVVWRGESIAIVMNLYPYSTGHLMIMPYEHVASPEELEDPGVMRELAEEIPSAMRAMRRVLRCQGFNTGMNTGAVAGAGIADHMHMHLVPRWGGDANFMPIIGNTTVMPEVLSVTYAKLRAELIVEHDESRLPSALVLSKDRSHALLLDGGELPATSTDHEQSLVASMRSILAKMGVDAVVTGWAGDDTVVWEAVSNAKPVAGQWVSIAALPGPIARMANEALRRMQASISRS